MVGLDEVFFYNYYEDEGEWKDWVVVEGDVFYLG